MYLNFQESFERVSSGGGGGGGGGGVVVVKGSLDSIVNWKAEAWKSELSSSLLFSSLHLQAYVL